VPRSLRGNVEHVERTVRTVLSTIVHWVRQESAATQALIQAFIAVGIAFSWWHWTNAQTGAVVGISAALLGMFVRSQVTPLIRPVGGGQPLVPKGSEAAREAEPGTAHAAP
jgi:hypothetical protein